eukprot:XP_002942126.2 PREDICTED: DNA damage-induced apoptosis suppressor protein [Xenopus tropicalis]
MNGKRRFLRASVLSVLGSSCTYPACQHCFTRLIRAANRFECPRCGSQSKEAKQRYKLCLKVAEWSQLYIITVFGSCLDKIFGTSASALQRQLQCSVQTWSNLASDRAQELLNQAVEQCFVGRNFLFGVKIPEGRREEAPPGSVSLCTSRSHMVACQIFLPNDGAVGFTVMDCYGHLLRSMVNGTQADRRSVSSDHSKKDLSDTGSTFSLHVSANYLDLWQQSFGLTSSSGSRESSKIAEHHFLAKDGEFKGNNQDFLCTNLSVETKAIPETALPIGSSAGTLSSKSSRQSFNNSSIASRNGHKVSGFLACGRTFELHGKELHKSWHPVSSPSQFSPPCTAVSSSKNLTAAGIHQDGADVWDDSLYSESLSEFLAKVENNEETSTRSCNNDSMGATRHPDRFPRMQHCVDTMTHRSKKQFSIDTDPPSEEELAKCSSPPFIKQTMVNVSPLAEAITPSNFSPFPVNRTCENNKCQISQNTPKPRKVLWSKHVLFDAKKYGSQKTHLSQICTTNGSTSYTPSLLKGTCRDSNEQANWQVFACWEEPSLINKRFSDCKKSYNVSSDLFDISKSPNETVEDAARLLSVKGIYPEEREGCCLNTPKSGSRPADVDALQKSGSLTWPDINDESALGSPSLIPFAQSTPVIKHLPRPSCLGANRPPLKPLNGRSNLVPTKKSGDLLKKATRHRTPSFLHISKSPDLWGLNSSSEKYSPLPSTKRLSVSPLVNLGVNIPQRRWWWRRNPSSAKTAKRDHLEPKENIKGGPEGDTDTQDMEAGGKETKMVASLRMFNGSTELSPIQSTCDPTVQPFPRVQAPLPPGDWSPELFIEKGPTSQQSDLLQRRLF